MSLRKEKLKPKNRWFKHEKTGRLFYLIYVTNEHARSIKRSKWPVEAIYQDEQYRLWSCPLSEFASKFVEIDATTGRVVRGRPLI